MPDDSNDDGYNGYGGDDGGYYYCDGRYERKKSHTRIIISFFSNRVSSLYIMRSKTHVNYIDMRVV